QQDDEQAQAEQTEGNKAAHQAQFVAIQPQHQRHGEEAGEEQEQLPAEGPSGPAREELKIAVGKGQREAVHDRSLPPQAPRCNRGAWLNVLRSSAPAAGSSTPHRRVTRSRPTGTTTTAPSPCRSRKGFRRRCPDT